MFKRFLNKSSGKQNPSESEPPPEARLLPPYLVQILARLREEFGESSSLVIRTFDAGSKDQYRAAIAYIDGLADRSTINAHVLRATMVEAEMEREQDERAEPLVESINHRLITASQSTVVGEWKQVIEGIAGGDTAVFIDGSKCGIVVSTPGWERRGVDEPVSESVVRGPRDGFTETLRTNETLIRRRIRSPRLRFDPMTIGEMTQTSVSIAYVKGIAAESMVEEVRGRLDSIKVDSVLESGYLEEYIQDSPWSVFPQLLRTERPDIVAANLLEGRVAIFTDNTPFVLVLPVTFTQLLSSPEDYYERFPTGTLIRILRYASFIMSIILPAVYIAITTYHQELLPTDLILAIAVSREGVPFPALVEALLLEVVFEVLREAGIRLPRVIGQAVSIVGALVVGDAAVSAGLVSPAMVIVVATTAISSFATPTFSFALSGRILRFGFMFSAATLGLFGIQLAGLLLLLHLASLRSYGVPYLTPFAPLRTSDLKDTVLRVPMWTMISRPSSIPNENHRRQKTQMRWRPPAGETESETNTDPADSDRSGGRPDNEA